MRRGRVTQRVTAVLLLGVMGLVGLTLAHVWRVTAAAQAESRAYARSLADTLAKGLEDKAAAVAKAASSLAQNAYVEAYYAADSITERAENLRVFHAFALNAIADNPDMLAVGLVDLEGRALTVGTQMDAVMLAHVKRAYPLLLNPAPFDPFFTGAIRLNGRIPYYAYVLPVYDTHCSTPMTRLAACVVLCDLRRLQTALDQPLPDGFVDVRLLGGGGLLAARAVPARRESGAAETLIRDLPAAGWSLRCRLAPTARTLASPTWEILWQAGLTGLVMLTLVWLILRAGLARPVDAIIARLGTGKDLAHLGLRFDSELDIIVDTIQTTFARLERSTQERIRSQTEVYAMQLHLRESELNALQSQINPHFLYNTLECMRSIGLYYESPEIVAISTAMSDIFRYSIKGSPMVTLEEELAIVRQYLSIIDVRFDGRFAAEYDCAPEALGCVIPKMILQPLVENAIYHGLEPQKGGGTVTLRARLHDGALYISVEDDGVGMAPEDLQRLRAALAAPDAPIDRTSRQRSVGLINIAQRVRLFAQGNCAVNVQSQRGGGTRVCLTFDRARCAPAVHD